MSQVKKNQNLGFTIIELMFAMTFVAILLVILIISVIQITHTYNKGVTLKRVNQSGRTIGDEVQQAIQQSGNTAVYLAGQGRLCLGDYSFVWSQPTISGAHSVPGFTNYYDDVNHTSVGFAKVKDSKICDSPGSLITQDESTEILGDGLVMRQPTDFMADQVSNRLLTFKYTISTPDDGSGVFNFLSPTSDQIHCTGSSGDEFCALSTFEVTAYAKGL